MLNRNISLEQIDQLVESLAKMKALIQVVLTSDFDSLNKTHWHDYLWVIDDLLVQANTACCQLVAGRPLINQLLK